MINNDIGAGEQLRFCVSFNDFFFYIIQVNHRETTQTWNISKLLAKQNQLKPAPKISLTFTTTQQPTHQRPLLVVAATMLTIRDDAFFKVNLQSAKFQTDVLLGTRLD